MSTTVQPDFLSRLKSQRLTEELVASQKKLREYENLYFPSHLRAHTLTEELAAAQKKLKGYEDLFARLYHTACDHCKESFQRTSAVGANTVSGSNLAAGAVVTVSPASNAESSSTGPQPVLNPKCRRRLPGLSPHQQGSTTSSVSSWRTQPNAPTFGVSTEQLHLSDMAPPNSSTFSPAKDTPTQAQCSVKFHTVAVDGPTLQVELEYEWPFDSVTAAVKFKPDGKYLAVGLCRLGWESQKTYIYDVAKRKKVCMFADPHASANRYLGYINYLSFSPGDGVYLATGHNSGRTIIWQVEQKRVRNILGANQVSVNTSVDFSPDGRFVVSCSNVGCPTGVRIWLMRDGSSSILRDPVCEKFWAVAVTFSPDGKYVVASDDDGMLRLWNVRTLKLVRRWRAHFESATCVAFTPDGRGLVTGSRDQTLKYWDLGQPGFDGLRVVEVLRFVGHTDRIREVAVSPDGRWVVTGSVDNTARIWDIADASLKCTLVGHKQGIRSVDFSPMDKYVACGGWDGKISVWRYGESRG